MTMKFEFDGWMRPYEYRAVGNMFYALADGLEADRKERGFEDGPSEASGEKAEPLSPDAEVLPDEGPNYAAMKEAHEAAEAPKRERGKPAPGKARRTKEEIAEDEAADKADAAAAPGEEPKAAISTGEERIDPTTAEDAAQDAKDEAAEAEATKPEELTHDSVRAALQKYLNIYGAAATMEDGPKVFKMLFGDKAAKVSDIPTDQASLAKAVAGVEEMTAKNPFNRAVYL